MSDTVSDASEAVEPPASVPEDSVLTLDGCAERREAIGVVHREIETEA